MRKVIFLAALTAAFAGQCYGQVSKIYSAADLRCYAGRMERGPYNKGFAPPAWAPNDREVQLRYSAEFRAAPVVVGNAGAPNETVWPGYGDKGFASTASDPAWHGVKVVSAALEFTRTKDQALAAGVRAVLLEQLKQPAESNMGTWGSRNPRPGYEHGFLESAWLTRLVIAYDLTRGVAGLYSTAEKADIDAYFNGAAAYHRGRIHENLVQFFPQRLSWNYAEGNRRSSASKAGELAYRPFNMVYAPPAHDYQRVWGGSYIFTHRAANGALGDTIASIAARYNNRASLRMCMVGLVGLVTGDTVSVFHAKTYYREMVAMLPRGGLSAEYERLGSWGNISQGLWYDQYNIQDYMFFAVALANNGDRSLLALNAPFDIHNARGMRSMRTAVDTLAEVIAGRKRIYYNTVTEQNRVRTWALQSNGRVENNVGWVHSMVLASRVLDGVDYRPLYNYQTPGQMMMQSVFTSSTIGLPVNNMGGWARWPALMMVFANREDSAKAVFRPAKFSMRGGDVALLRGQRSHFLMAIPLPGVRVVGYEWIKLEGPGVRLRGLNGQALIITGERLWGALHPGTYRFRARLKLSDGTREEQDVSFRVQ